MIKQTLHYTNPNKRVIAKLAGGKSIVEYLESIVNNEARFKYAIAWTDEKGTALMDDGITLTGDELKGLATAITRLAERGDIQPTRTLADYRAIYPEQARTQRKPLF